MVAIKQRLQDGAYLLRHGAMLFQVRYHPRKPVVVFEVVNWFPDGEVLV